MIEIIWEAHHKCYIRAIFNKLFKSDFIRTFFISFFFDQLMPKTLDAEEDGKGSLCALYRKETWSPKLEQAPRQCRRKHTLRSVSVRTCVTDTLACTRAALTLPQLKFFVPAGARVHRRRRTRCSLILLLLPGSRRMFSRIILYIYIY